MSVEENNQRIAKEISLQPSPGPNDSPTLHPQT